MFRNTQLRLDLVKQLRDMWAIVTFLEDNTIESDKAIYDGMDIKTLAEQVYDELLSIAKSTVDLHDSLKPVPQKTKEKIGTLLNSREMNPAEFFSFQFKMGVYLPLLSPFIVPLLLTFTIAIRHKLYLIFCKKKNGGATDDVKVKTD